VTRSALIVVGKRPEPGFTKTRLCPPLSPEAAAEFYRCLLLDTLALAASLEQVDHVLAYAPSEARAYFEDLVPVGFQLVAQQGANLGERLAYALESHFQQGYHRVVIMNSDGPTLPLGYLDQAFSALDRADVSLGPGHDGGYYLIGMRRFHAPLFQGIAWSTARVIPQTLDICGRLGLSVHQLPEWYDVDVGADLERLQRELAHEPAAAPRTAAFLRGDAWSGPDPDSGGRL
jgi:rSAM/selenodomain-associated transferase 1